MSCMPITSGPDVQSIRNTSCRRTPCRMPQRRAQSIDWSSGKRSVAPMWSASAIALPKSMGWHQLASCSSIPSESVCPIIARISAISAYGPAEKSHDWLNSTSDACHRSRLSLATSFLIELIWRGVLPFCRRICVRRCGSTHPIEQYVSLGRRDERRCVSYSSNATRCSSSTVQLRPSGGPSSPGTPPPPWISRPHMRMSMCENRTDRFSRPRTSSETLASWQRFRGERSAGDNGDSGERGGSGESDM
mmetsp:Transcript_10394/g.27614  ORF Transcript_10394/g.27614 Transcript_10394/m.27614 type:complete len:248 (+) Transcript_10394:234-977(+)